jgi:NAD(P)H-hydrate epimerase
MRVLTAEQMATVDRRAVEELGVPSMILMENAAIGLADALGRHFPDAAEVTLLCGPGNNGGDGLALARHLEARGYSYRVFLVAKKDPGGDAGHQLAILEKSGIEVERVLPESELGPVLAACRGCDLVVDALFGTGLSRPLGGHFRDLVEGLSGLPVPILAVDLPSGLDGSHADPPGLHLRAELTVTFAAPKVAHVFHPAAEATGELVVADLGVPAFLVDQAPGDLHLITAPELAPELARRRPDAHKGDFGHLLIVAGGPGKAGAAILAARAAVRSGAGLVTAAVPAPILQTVDGGSLESMSLPLEADGAGVLARGAADQVLAAAEGKGAVAMGPGLGVAEGTVEAVRRLARELAVPLVLDADALNAHAGRLGDLRDRDAAAVLTPHPGEMGRLLGLGSKEVQADRPGAARRAAEESGAVVILKGHRTLVADPEGGIHVNPTGNPGMASGGSGDVLTGMVAAFLAQGYPPALAARLGVYLHGLAGDVAIERIAPEALRAGDLIEALSESFERLRRSA